jgi:hypothetical protein
MKDRAIPGLLALAAACLGLAGTRHAPLARMRGAAPSATAPADAPPLVAFTTVALGGFRGLLADALWLRAAHLQDEGRFFELLQLSDWIAKLQPRCSEVWAFHAWNMAYNLSAAMDDPNDRWRWVQNAIRLLRDEGIALNPTDPDLYFELGWLFQNKIGHPMDPAHLYYRRQWAAVTTDLLGGPHPDYARLAADSAAARRLWDALRLTPDLMQALDEAHGPLDWRLPQTHAAYWAWLGSRRARGKPTQACDRLLCQALVDGFLEGRLDFAPRTHRYLATPDPDRFAGVVRAYEASLARRDSPNTRIALRNFLREAVLVLHLYGRSAQSREALATLRRRFPSTEWPETPDALAQRLLTDGRHPPTRARALAVTEGFFYRATLARAKGEADPARQAEALATAYWSEYLARRSPEERERLALPTADDLRGQAERRAFAEKITGPPRATQNP